jgi:hypothetical protein
MLQASVLNISFVFFQTYVASIFIWMLCMFLTYCHAFQVFSQMFHTHVLSVSSFFRRMLQKFHRDVGTCCNVTHLPQPPAPAAGAPCMRVGNGGMEHCAVAGAGSDAGVQ